MQEKLIVMTDILDELVNCLSDIHPDYMKLHGVYRTIEHFRKSLEIELSVITPKEENERTN